MSTNTATKPAPAAKVEAKADSKPGTETLEGVEVTPDVKKQYTPASDSTSYLKTRAEKEGKLILDLSDGACLCGCRGKSRGRFQPGHDARLKGKLVRATVANVKMLILMGDEEQEATPRQFAKLLSGKYDWVKGLEESVQRVKDQEKEREARRVEAAKKAEERRANAASKGKGKISLDDFASV